MSAHNGRNQRQLDELLEESRRIQEESARLSQRADKLRAQIEALQETNSVERRKQARLKGK